MDSIPQALRKVIAANIRRYRLRKFPGRGGAKKCALAYGVSPQQWSPWERGTRTPGETHLQRIADFFGVDVASLLRPGGDAAPEKAPSGEPPPPDFCPHTPTELYPFLLNRRIKAIYRVELSVTDLTFEPCC